MKNASEFWSIFHQLTNTNTTDQLDKVLSEVESTLSPFIEYLPRRDQLTFQQKITQLEQQLREHQEREQERQQQCIKHEYPEGQYKKQKEKQHELHLEEQQHTQYKYHERQQSKQQEREYGHNDRVISLTSVTQEQNSSPKAMGIPSSLSTQNHCNMMPLISSNLHKFSSNKPLTLCNLKNQDMRTNPIILEGSAALVIRGCSDLKLKVHCAQLRLTDCHRMQIELCLTVKNGGIMEGCSDVQIIPWQEHSGCTVTNHWSTVRSF